MTKSTQFDVLNQGHDTPYIVQILESISIGNGNLAIMLLLMQQKIYPHLAFLILSIFHKN